MASSSSIVRRYDVFLNFRGSDTRDGFTSYLYEALRLAEINTFIDNKLERGEEISTALVQEIESSSISVVILSQNYAFSSYCLDELVKIIECRESIGQNIIPVFYNVDPADIEELEGSYGEAFAQHEAKFVGQNDKLEKWKSALQKTINISGWHITNNKDAPKCIKRIVLTISKKLNEEKQETFERTFRELQAIEADINSQLEDGESILYQRQKNEAGNWLTNVGRIKEEAKAMHKQLESNRWTIQFGVCLPRMIEEMRKLIDQKGVLASDLVTDAPQSNREAFLIDTLVGQKFQSDMDSILRFLSMDEVSSIGICGMGGVGKTYLLTHIHNKVLENPTKFPNVYWVTMSRDFSIQKLQSLIAKTIKFEFGTEEDVRKRAARLSKELHRRGRVVLIIDDLWNPINMIEVGIPVGSECKLIITTRSIEVCQQTNCQKIEKLEPLNKLETWDLFIESLACNLPSKVEKIARSVAKECDGLPLAIVTVARSLKGVDDLHAWKNALLELQSAIIRKDDMEGKVFRILRYSYSSLIDPTLQQCFLYCALFPEDEYIVKEDLITSLIVEGIIDPDIDLMQAKYDRGHAMLNKLTNVSLLESRSDGYVVMHDMMRDMAIQIIKEFQPSMIESGKGLVYVPDEKYWRKDLIRVSLGWNYLNEIPPNFSPSCPYLSTLLLHQNEKLLSIANSFFDHLRGLKILNLSYTAIKELPESVGDLKNLTTLLLGYSKICYMPTLSNLNSLQWLDISGCYSIKKVPDGLEYLSNLWFLNLSYTGIVEFPTGILPKLYRLQSLEYDRPSRNAEELVGLRRLECLKWFFPVVEDLLTFDTLISSMPIQMKFFLSVGTYEYNPHVFDEDDVVHAVMLTGCKIFGELRELRLQIDCLLLRHLSLENGRGLCSHIPVGLKWLFIHDCRGIVFLFNMATSHSIFQSLVRLRVTNMKEQIVLFLDSGSMVPPSPNPTLSFSLKVLQVRYCSVKKLLPHGVLSYLLNLETIEVHSARGLEEIISAEENLHTVPLCLPNLRNLHLSDLPSLKRICSEQIKCECLQSVGIFDCKDLQNISICFPLPHLLSVSVQPRKWWESVKWGQPDQKDALPCVFFRKWLLLLQLEHLKKLKEKMVMETEGKTQTEYEIAE